MPTTVANFVKLVRDGAYKGTVFSKVQCCMPVLALDLPQCTCIPSDVSASAPSVLLHSINTELCCKRRKRHVMCVRITGLCCMMSET